jgi:hypothetical protein
MLEAVECQDSLRVRQRARFDEQVRVAVATGSLRIEVLRDDRPPEQDAPQSGPRQSLHDLGGESVHVDGPGGGQPPFGLLLV